MGRWREGNPILLSPTKEREGEYLPHLLLSLLFFPFAHLSIQQQRWLSRPTSPFSPIFAFSCHPPARPHFLSFVPPIPSICPSIFLLSPFTAVDQSVRPASNHFPFRLCPQRTVAVLQFLCCKSVKNHREGENTAKKEEKENTQSQSIHFIPFGFPTSFQLEKSIFQCSTRLYCPHHLHPTFLSMYYLPYLPGARPYSFSPPLVDRSIISPSFEVDWQRSARSFWSPLNSLGLFQISPHIAKNCNFAPFSKF